MKNINVYVIKSESSHISKPFLTSKNKSYLNLCYFYAGKFSELQILTWINCYILILFNTMIYESVKYFDKIFRQNFLIFYYTRMNKFGRFFPWLQISCLLVSLGSICNFMDTPTSMVFGSHPFFFFFFTVHLNFFSFPLTPHILLFISLLFYTYKRFSLLIAGNLRSREWFIDSQSSQFSLRAFLD